MTNSADQDQLASSEHIWDQQDQGYGILIIKCLLVQKIVNSEMGLQKEILSFQSRPFSEGNQNMAELSPLEVYPFLVKYFIEWIEWKSSSETSLQ